MLPLLPQPPPAVKGQHVNLIINVDSSKLMRLDWQLDCLFAKCKIYQCACACIKSHCVTKSTYTLLPPLPTVCVWCIYKPTLTHKAQCYNIQTHFWLALCVCVHACVCSKALRKADQETDSPPLGLAERLLVHYGNKVTNSEVISPELPH